MNQNRIIYRLGVLLIIAGIICNEWLLARLLSPDHSLELPNRIKIWLLEILLSVGGFLLIIAGHRVSNFKSFFSRIIGRYPRIAASGCGVLVSLTLFTSAEISFLFLNGIKNKQESYIVQDRRGNIEYDETLGYRPRPNSSAQVIKMMNDRIVYDITYHFDEYSRRRTPVCHKEKKNFFALFFGCSFTFGAAVKEKETLPYYFSNLSPQYISYNYGYSGYGPQQMLSKLQQGNINEEIERKSGILVFTFIDDHIQRSIVSMNVYNGWGRDMPLYTINAEGNLIREGNFVSARPVLGWIYSLLGKSQILRYFNANLPPKVAECHIRTTCKILEEARNAFKKKFNSDNFYVLLYPGSHYTKEMVGYLRKAQIRHLDYSSLFENSLTAMSVPGDGHPNALAYRVVAKKLAEDIEAYSLHE